MATLVLDPGLATEEDKERLCILSQAMPPICRAFIHDQKPVRPWNIVSQFLHQTVDAFVRGNLASTSLLPSRPKGRSRVVPLPEQWLRALSSDDPVLTGSAKELKAFSSETQTWLSQIQPVASQAPFRTCFRLDPPTEVDKRDSRW